MNRRRLHVTHSWQTFHLIDDLSKWSSLWVCIYFSLTLCFSYCLCKFCNSISEASVFKLSFHLSANTNYPGLILMVTFGCMSRNQPLQCKSVSFNSNWAKNTEALGEDEKNLSLKQKEIESRHIRKTGNWLMMIISCVCMNARCYIYTSALI